jgi:hypothetical protein
MAAALGALLVYAMALIENLMLRRMGVQRVGLQR